MSIFSIADDTARRVVPSSDVYASDDRLRSGTAESAMRDGTPQAATPSATSDTTLEAFTKYIPAETISLYLAALPAVNNAWEWGRNLFIIMAVATPVLVLLLTFMRIRSRLPIEQQRQSRVVLQQMQPTITAWKMITATIAFIFWASAIPGNPFFLTNGDPTISTLVSSAFVFIGSFVIDFFTNLLFPSGVQ